MLLTNNLSFERNSKIVFQNINLSLPPKTIIQVTGRNGSGKTTLLKLLSSVLYPSNGQIFWDGKNLRNNSENLHKNLTFIMDNNTSKKDLTLIENINFWKHIFRSKKTNDEINRILSLLRLDEYKKILVKFMSFGEIRKLELCRLILENKLLWILDEPYLGLDKNTCEIINETFINHSKNGGMVIFSSHIKVEIPNKNELNLDEYEYI